MKKYRQIGRIPPIFLPNPGEVKLNNVIECFNILPFPYYPHHPVFPDIFPVSRPSYFMIEFAFANYPMLIFSQDEIYSPHIDGRMVVVNASGNPPFPIPPDNWSTNMQIGFNGWLPQTSTNYIPPTRVRLKYEWESGSGANFYRFIYPSTAIEPVLENWWGSQNLRNMVIWVFDYKCIYPDFQSNGQIIRNFSTNFNDLLFDLFRFTPDIWSTFTNIPIENWGSGTDTLSPSPGVQRRYVQILPYSYQTNPWDKRYELLT